MDSSKETVSRIESEKEKASFLDAETVDALRDLVQQRLQECGWRDDIRKLIRNILDERGVNNVSYEDIATEVLPKARAMVPDELRKELQMRMREAPDLTDQAEKN